MLNWAITFLLIGFVSFFFLLIGTGSDLASLLAELATVSSLVLAAAFFAAYAKQRHRHPGAS